VVLLTKRVLQSKRILIPYLCTVFTYGRNPLNCSGIHILTPQTPVAICIYRMLKDFQKKQHALGNRQSPHLAWIFTPNSHAEPSSNVLASLGFSPTQTFYIESTYPQRALTAVCAEPFFSAIIYSAPTTPSVLQIARRWLKPETESLIIPCSQLEKQNTKKIIILAGSL
jgi:hypothetical protein